jgi:uncharacterized protein YndB with AHSA1/START domain
MLPIIVALAFIAILIIVVAAGQADGFKLSRAAKISAPPEKVFPHINNLHKWEAWSPWAKLDPNAKNSFAGADSGVGAAMSWSGNKKIGEGRMTITESRANELIRFTLEFVKPFKATHMAEFAFKSEGNQTVVTWSMSGKSNLFFKAFGLFMNCDDMAGKDFEKGLAAMKSVVEATGNH